MLSLNGYLLYATGNPKHYQNLSNSKVLNNGLWVQTAYSMVLCITLMIYSIRNRHLRIKMLQQILSIDEIFQNDFQIVYNYTGLHR